MNLFQGRILITNCSNEADVDYWDGVIRNILNHKSSRATIYVMTKSIFDVQTIEQKFPTVVPFVLVPDENIDQTRRMLKLLPHMDHYLNFLGQEVALEFLNKRSNFRIKNISKVYARDNVIHKILSTDGQGLIFNVENADDNYCKDNVAAAGIAAKKSLKKNVKKVVDSIVASSSTGERRPLLQRDEESHKEQVRAVGSEEIDSEDRNRLGHFVVSFFYFICPCVKDATVIIPVNEYPPDLDEKFAKALKALHRSFEAEWYRKRTEERHLKGQMLKQLKDTKTERVKKEYQRLMATNSEAAPTNTNQYKAFSNVTKNIRMEKETIEREFEFRMNSFDDHLNCVIVDKQMETLLSLWKKMRLTSH
ncbi:hypothetical protein Bhyg_09214 [Pseudolycoriella hygida]|uniref:Uncharacterized protein n=1 Tax=Pseudolycoriella hygida TaxID=35572 RepID=A0A9Q0S3Q3_9DIPT|nr:hypothetical protein Bhyg_09214 [Pseudolycoriella hygida]